MIVICNCNCKMLNVAHFHGINSKIKIQFYSGGRSIHYTLGEMYRSESDTERNKQISLIVLRPLVRAHTLCPSAWRATYNKQISEKKNGVHFYSFWIWSWCLFSLGHSYYAVKSMQFHSCHSISVCLIIMSNLFTQFWYYLTTHCALL